MCSCARKKYLVTMEHWSSKHNAYIVKMFLKSGLLRLFNINLDATSGGRNGSASCQRPSQI
jgi:hypothetical protein